MSELSTDRPGSDYRWFVPSDPTSDVCKMACEAEGNCKAWTFVRPGVQGAEARCWLKTDVPAARPSTCCTSGVVLRPKPEPVRPGEKPFDLPTFRGFRVDRCLNFSSQCEEPAATAFCKLQGYVAAERWAWELTSPTMSIGDQRVCRGDGQCGGFTLIACR